MHDFWHEADRCQSYKDAGCTRRLLRWTSWSCEYLEMKNYQTSKCLSFWNISKTLMASSLQSRWVSQSCIFPTRDKCLWGGPWLMQKLMVLSRFLHQYFGHCQDIDTTWLGDFQKKHILIPTHGSSSQRCWIGKWDRSRYVPFNLYFFLERQACSDVACWCAFYLIRLDSWLDVSSAEYRI